MSRDETYKDSVECVESQAPEAFGSHVITERRPWLWKCARPDSWTYGFYVAVMPGCVHVYGDIDASTYRMSNGPEMDVLLWLTRSAKDRFYLLSKLEHREAYKRFYPGDAVTFVNEMRKEYRAADQKRREQIGDFATEVITLAEAGDLYDYRFYELAQEAEIYDFPACKEWSPSAIWSQLALKRFVELGPTVSLDTFGRWRVGAKER